MEREPLHDIQEQWAKNQDRWKGYTRKPAEHLLILTEEVGEVARSMQSEPAIDDMHVWPPEYTEDTYHEIIDAAAVLLAMAFECREAME